MKTRGWLIIGFFLLVMPLVFGFSEFPGFSGESNSFEFQKNHQGLQGEQVNATDPTNRFTLTYNQPGNRFGNSTSFTTNVGWFSIPEEEEEVPPERRGSGRGGGGGGGGGRRAECNDLRDNDGDGRIDMADPDCTSLSDTSESGTAECVPSWSCTSWSACEDGKQTRVCSDLNQCKEDKAESRGCIEKEIPAPTVEPPKIERPATVAKVVAAPSIGKGLGSGILRFLESIIDGISVGFGAIAGLVNNLGQYAYILWWLLLLLIAICIILGGYYYVYPKLSTGLVPSEFERSMKSYDQHYTTYASQLGDINKRIERLNKRL